MPEADHKDGDLHDICGDEEVVADGRPAMVLEEDHEEAEADKDHHVHVLEQRVVRLHLVLCSGLC